MMTGVAIIFLHLDQEFKTIQIRHHDVANE